MMKEKLTETEVEQVKKSIEETDQWLVNDSTKEDVLKTAAKLQKKIHPDMNRDVNSERLSQLVNEAKEKIIKTDFN